MKKFTTLFLALIVLFLSSCSIIGGIFKAGFAAAIVVVVIVIVLIIWLISAFKGKG